MPEELGRRGPCSAETHSGLFLLWIVRIGISLVLMTPLIVTQDLFFPFVVGKALFARSIIEITFAFWAALVLFHRRLRPSWSWVIIAFAVWLLVSWIAAVFGVSPTRSIWSTYERMQGVFDLAHWFAFALMASSVFKSAADWRLLFSINLVFSTAVCAASLAYRFGLIDIGLLEGQEGRLGSTLGNPMYLGAYTMLSALMGAALFVQTRGQPASPVVRRIGSSAAGGLCALMVLVNLWVMWFSGTRSALASLGAAALACAAYAAWSGGKTRRRAAGAVAALILSAASLVAVARTTTILDPVVESSVMLSRMSDIPQDSSVRWRVSFVETGLRAFLDRPLLGWGPENFLVAWGRYNSADTSVSDHSHNSLVEELTTKGVLGLMSYFAVWAVVMSVALRSLGRQSGRDLLHLGLIGAALVACFVQGLFQNDTSVSMMQFSLLAAFVASVEARGRTRESPRGADSSRRRAALRASLDRMAGLLTKRVRALVLVLVIALTIASLDHWNIRLRSAASAAAAAMASSRPWLGRLDDFIGSIRGFSGLANYPRMYFIEAAALLDGVSEEDFQRTVDLVALEVGRGSRAEPQNWLLEARAAAFYQKAATRDAKYMDVARRHVDRAAELAPGISSVIALVNAQESLEAAAREALARPD